MTQSKWRLFFGHPRNTFGEKIETDLLAFFTTSFPVWDIENPNTAIHINGYEVYKKKRRGAINYFLKEVVPLCHGGVFLTFRDNAWDAENARLARHLVERGHKNSIWKVAPIWEGFNMKQIFSLKDEWILTTKETRSRVWNSQKGITRPY